ncbi:Gfo/Idh/MocA family protein [Microbacterium sp. NPDC057944]|uniref:Gfo/Idh/MocA family protein n=1 Tax=Microbacterium sp. NPDC057944 TaxID=3346286 RepID=UPI0036DECDA1
MTGLRWGILATGGIAGAFASDLRSAGLDLVAVGSRSQESADAFAAAHGIAPEHTHPTYEALVADPDVDIVYVSTPHPMHHDNARLALEAGKHVLVEKAFTVNRAEAESLQRLGAERGLLVMEAMWTRYLPQMVRMRELIASGALGEIRTVSASHTQYLPSDPAHRLNALELGGGALLDLSIYPISFIWDVLGAPTSIQAAGRLVETGADAEVATVMVHEGGAVSTSFSSSRAAGSNTASILGTRARIEIQPAWSSASTLRLIAPDGTVLEEIGGPPAPDAPRGMEHEAHAAERLVRDGLLEGDILPIAQTVAIMGTLDEIRAQIGVTYPTEESHNG